MFDEDEYGNISLKKGAGGKILAFLAVPLVITLAWIVWSSVMFYGDAGYRYHVRTMFGQETVIERTGFAWKGPLGRVERYKKAMTIQVGPLDGSNQRVSEQTDPYNTYFLDNVDADFYATVRFEIPSGEQFLEMARKYRTPENLIQSSLKPSVLATLRATAATITAEAYFGGGAGQFSASFSDQMTNGIIRTERQQELRDVINNRTSSANASLEEQTKFQRGDQQVVVVAKPVLDSEGEPIVNKHSFSSFGVQVVSAVITNVDADDDFERRIDEKKAAAAQRAIAIEKTLEEEEQKKLAVARGDRQVAERQAEAKQEQIQRTTEAETEKQLAVTEANKRLETERIAKETALVELERAKIEAQTVRERAEAEAYAKEAILTADGALAQKLEAMVRMNGQWADAYAKRAVPTLQVTGNGEEGGGSNLDTQTQAFMTLIMGQMLGNLNDPTLNQVR